MDEPKRSNVSRFDGNHAAGDTSRYGARDDEMLPISHSDRQPPLPGSAAGIVAVVIVVAVLIALRSIMEAGR